MHDYMTVRQKESRCPSLKHSDAKTKLKRLDDNIFLKKLSFLFFLFNKKGL